MVFLSQSQLQLQLLAIAVAITIAVNWCCFTDRTGFGGCGVVGSESLDPWVVVSGSLDFLVVGLGSGSKQQSSLASKFNPAGQLSIPHLSPSMQSLSPSQSPWST